MGVFWALHKLKRYFPFPLKAKCNCIMAEIRQVEEKNASLQKNLLVPTSGPSTATTGFQQSNCFHFFKVVCLCASVCNKQRVHEGTYCHADTAPLAPLTSDPIFAGQSCNRSLLPRDSTAPATRLTEPHCKTNTPTAAQIHLLVKQRGRWWKK